MAYQIVNISKTRNLLAVWKLLESWKDTLQELPGASRSSRRPDHGTSPASEHLEPLKVTGSL